MDGKLFDRLHRGPLDPLIFHLKEGGALTGQLLAVRRFGAAGKLVGPLGGEICLAIEGGRTSLSYDQIDDIE